MVILVGRALVCWFGPHFMVYVGKKIGGIKHSQMGVFFIVLPTLDVLTQNVKPFFGGLIPMFDGWTAARL